MKKYKVHFLGGEGINWALDHDIVHLSRLSQDFVEVVPIEKAEIIHSVYWGALLTVPEKYLKRSLVIASIADKPQIVLSRPEYLKVRDKIDVWLCEYYESLNFISNCGLNCMLFPDPIDVEQFKPPSDKSASVRGIKEKYGIGQDTYLIGNFHRDSAMGALDRPKKQKGADVFLEVATILHQRGLPVHFLLAGPRRHFIRNGFKARGIPYTFVGEELESDDIKENTLNLDQVAELYRGVDAYVIASRWEGAPNSVLECSASKTKVVSTRVGQSPDILFREQIFESALEGADKLEKDFKENYLEPFVLPAYERIQKYNADSMVAGRLKYIYQQAIKAGKSCEASSAFAPKKSFFQNLFGQKNEVPPASHDASIRRQEIAKRISNKKSFTFALWNDFQPPPYGGGNQFMIALESALHRKGMQTVRNTGKGADAHIIQSIWFDQKVFDEELEPGAVVIHRVDGPIQLYRGNDFKSDPLCWELNAKYADVTVMQSSWSMDMTHNLGFSPKRPVLMWNSCDHTIFNADGRAGFSTDRKIKIISTAWSDNPRKGKDIYKWLDQNLDFDRFEYTFIGRIKESFENIKVIEPVDSKTLASHLKAHDIYLTASQKDPCSNSLVEALQCGLPAVYFSDGGHPELVGFGGLGFVEKEEIPNCLDRIVEHYTSFQNNIWVDSIDDLAQKYIDSVHYCAVI